MELNKDELVKNMVAIQYRVCDADQNPIGDGIIDMGFVDSEALATLSLNAKILVYRFKYTRVSKYLEPAGWTPVKSIISTNGIQEFIPVKYTGRGSSNNAIEVFGYVRRSQVKYIGSPGGPIQFYTGELLHEGYWTYTDHGITIRLSELSTVSDNRWIPMAQYIEELSTEEFDDEENECVDNCEECEDYAWCIGKSMPNEVDTDDSSVDEDNDSNKTDIDAVTENVCIETYVLDTNQHYVKVGIYQSDIQKQMDITLVEDGVRTIVVPAFNMANIRCGDVHINMNEDGHMLNMTLVYLTEEPDVPENECEMVKVWLKMVDGVDERDTFPVTKYVRKPDLDDSFEKFVSEGYTSKSVDVFSDPKATKPDQKHLLKNLVIDVSYTGKAVIDFIEKRNKKGC